MIFAVADDVLTALGERLQANSQGAVTGFEVAFGDLTLAAEASRIVQVLTALRDDAETPFQQLIDMTAIDYPERGKRFDVVYLLLSMTANRRVRIKVQAGESEPVNTVTGVYPCADWYEREVFDMFGVPFDGHPDLRRILTDYGFQGHPLRKDFPMTGYVEVRYDDEQKRVVYEPVKITQFRAFDFLSPWEGAEYVLPGDEKAEAK
jgi:NADH-quinone oxidoreductase subunit C